MTSLPRRRIPPAKTAARSIPMSLNQRKALTLPELIEEHLMWSDATIFMLHKANAPGAGSVARSASPT